MRETYDLHTIQLYIEGKLDAKSSYLLEKAALEDPMLQDAIDGLSFLGMPSEKALGSLQKKLNARISEEQEKRNHFFFGRQRLAVASVAGLLFLLASLLYWMVNFPTNQADTRNPKEVSMQQLQPLQVFLTDGNARPSIGWDSYIHYLTVNQEKKFSKSVATTLSFDIINGEVKNIKVISTDNVEFAQEIKTLLIAGPSWEGSTGTISIK